MNDTPDDLTVEAEAGNMTTETYCWRCGISLAPSPATEAERQGGEG